MVYGVQRAMALAGILVLGVMALVLLGCSIEQAKVREKIYGIKDECGPIQGNIYHSIKDNSTCRIWCRNHCTSLDFDFISSKFVDKGIYCHECNCTCRTTD